MIDFSINKFFEEIECQSIIERMDKIGKNFSYNPNETWDCKRIYDETFKSEILNRIKKNYEVGDFKLWFDLNSFDTQDINISLTKYYENRWLDLHLDTTSQFTTVILLSKNFDDGRFVLSNKYDNINNGEKYNLGIGQSISFNGSKIYHGVMPVHTGIRIAMNIWMTNTDFKYEAIKNNKSIL